MCSGPYRVPPPLMGANAFLESVIPKVASPTNANLLVGNPAMVDPSFRLPNNTMSVYVPALTKARACALLDELMAGYRTSRFQKKLQTLLNQARVPEGQDSAVVPGREKLMSMAVHEDVLPRFGFPSDERGWQYMWVALLPFQADSEVSAKMKAMKCKLRFPQDCDLSRPPQHQPSAAEEPAVAPAEATKPAEPEAETQAVEEDSTTEATRNRLITYMKDALTEFSKPSFQKKVRALKGASKLDAGNDFFHLPGRSELALNVQKRILPLYGFEADKSGVDATMALCLQHRKDAEVTRLMDAINMKLGMSELGCRRFWDQAVARAWYSSLGSTTSAPENPKVAAPAAAQVDTKAAVALPIVPFAMEATRGKEASLPAPKDAGERRAPELTAAEGAALLSKLLIEFGSTSFQAQLLEVISEAVANGCQDFAHVPGRRDLTLPVYNRVLPDFGFEASPRGRFDMFQALQPLMLDSSISTRADALRRKLRIPKKQYDAGAGFGSDTEEEACGIQPAVPALDAFEPVEARSLLQDHWQSTSDYIPVGRWEPNKLVSCCLVEALSFQSIAGFEGSHQFTAASAPVNAVLLPQIEPPRTVKISKVRALTLLMELLHEMTSKSFRKQLIDLSREAEEREDAAETTVSKMQELISRQRADVLQKQGFDGGSDEDIAEMWRSVDPWLHDPMVAGKAWAVQCVLRCLGERVRRAKSKPAAAKYKPVVAPEALEKDEALALQNDLLENCTTLEVQNELNKVWRQHKPESLQADKASVEVFYSVLTEVIPKHGFLASEVGIEAMTDAFRPLLLDLDVQVLWRLIDTAMSPLACGRHMPKPGAGSRERTKLDVIHVLRALLETFSTQEFQNQVLALKEASHVDDCDHWFHLAGRAELALSVQRHILPKYGFEGTCKGVHVLISYVTRHIMDVEVWGLYNAVNEKLGMQPNAIRRARQRLVRVHNEWQSLPEFGACN